MKLKETFMRKHCKSKTDDYSDDMSLSITLSNGQKNNNWGNNIMLFTIMQMFVQ